MSAGGNKGSEGAQVVKEGITKIHGAGEALRGTINSFADTLVDKNPSTKSANVLDRGERELKTGQYEGTGAGVTPFDTPEEKRNRAVQGEHGVGNLGVGNTRGGI